MVRRERGSSVDHHYLHRDHLGSITAVTDEASGQVVGRYSYDAWGKRRTASNWQAADVVTSLNYRGYTGHEHLDDVGIIHMNGRIYLPKLGKMMSPDPITQSPENGQNYSRYSYVFNNPLKFTDPSGYKSDIDRAHIKPVSAPAYEGSKPLEHVSVVGSRGERMALLFHNELMNTQWFNRRGSQSASGGDRRADDTPRDSAGDKNEVTSEDSAFISVKIAEVLQFAYDSQDGFSANFNLAKDFSISLTDAGHWEITQNGNTWEIDEVFLSSVGRNLVERTVGRLELGSQASRAIVRQ